MTRILTILLFVLLLGMTAMADVPNLINYQGRLTSLAGTPYNGSKPVKFTIYDHLGIAIWNSGSVSVTFTDGLFAVQLGAPPQAALPSGAFGVDSSMTLGITVDTDPEITPRTRLVTVPYSFNALNGGGWMDNAGLIYQMDTTKKVMIGTQTYYTGTALTVTNHAAGPVSSAGSFTDNGTGFFNNAIRGVNSSTSGITALFVQGSNNSVTAEPSAISAHSSDGPAIQATTEAGPITMMDLRFFGAGRGVLMFCDSNADAFYARPYGGGFGLRSENGKGIYVQSDSLYAGEFHSNVLSSSTHVTHSEFSGSGSADAIAVYGKSTPGDNWGVGGYFEGGYRGAYGFVSQPGSGSYIGVLGEARGDGGGTKYGVYGTVLGASGGKFGVYGSAPTGLGNYAGYFAGNCNVTGTLTKGAGAFKIDHPIDPANKYLQHSFVESPDMKNIYDGVVTLDVNGSAVVNLPDWFQALNDNFRYQLTCIGGYAPVYVASEVSGNQFSIGGGSAGLKVSWQVTGVRKDAYAQAHRIQVEVAKTGEERNHYMHAAELGKPKELGMDYVREHEATASTDANRFDPSKQENAPRASVKSQPAEPKPQVQPPVEMKR